MSIRIITDSASDIAQGSQQGLEIVPLSITFGEGANAKVYADGVDLTPQRFYELLVETDTLPKTSQPAPGLFRDAYLSAREANDDVVVITIASGLSGTYQSAQLALSEIEAKDPEWAARVHIIESGSACVGQRALVEWALRMVREGMSCEQIVKELELRKRDLRVVVLLDTLEYLRRGGRLTGGAAAVGTLLSIKPVVELRDGVISILGKARGSKNGKNLLNQKIEAVGGIDYELPINVGYAGTSAHLANKYIDDSSHLWESASGKPSVWPMGATIGTHTGPGAIAVSFFAKRV